MRGKSLLLVFAAGAVLATAAVVSGTSIRLPGDHRDYAPAQPVAFSHATHVGDLGISCLYCHGPAERSRHAGLPADATCMNCHRAVAAPLAAVREEAEAAKREGRPVRPVVSPELRKLYRAQGLADDGTALPGATVAPIRWVRVHNLPDHAYFDHRAHVAAGLACETCHGPVDTMERVRQVESLSMGWCVNCHRDANQKGLPGGRPARASTDCTTCHR